MALLLLLAALAGNVLIGCSMPQLTRVSDPAFPTPQTCSECHVDITREWEQSPHANAFVNARFKQATNDYQFEKCFGCHAPRPGMVTEMPTARLARRELGVTCVSCHLRDGAMVGPIPPTGFAEPHPIVVDPAPFENGQLCGHCHEGTLAQWQAASMPDKEDCRACHMPQVMRKITQATGMISRPIVAAEEEVVQHRHTFTLVPTDLKNDPIAIDIARIPDSDDVAIRLTNLLPHNLPTGDFGVRLVIVQAVGVQSDGAQRPLGQWEITSRGDNVLAAGQSRQWTLKLPPDLRSMRVRVCREGRDGANPAELLSKEATLR